MKKTKKAQKLVRSRQRGRVEDQEEEEVEEDFAREAAGRGDARGQIGEDEGEEEEAGGEGDEEGAEDDSDGDGFAGNSHHEAGVSARGRRKAGEGEDALTASTGGVGDDEPPRKKVKGPLTLKSVAKFQKKQDNSGVVYLSRVPPYMKPEKVRHLLGRYGKVGRVFLTPEDPAVRSKRKAMGGNKRQNYLDGWIEFDDKGDAKRVAKELNTRAIGGKSTSFYSADLWNLKYLSKFKWHHLTEKIAYDNTVRRHKLQAEIAQAKREKDFYLERVDQSKQIDKKSKKMRAEAAAGEKQGGGGGVLRTFRQAPGIEYLEQAGGGAGTKRVQGDAIKKPQGSVGPALLSKIFGC